MFRKLASRVVGVFSSVVGSGRAMVSSVFGQRRGDPPVRGTREFLEVYDTSPWVRAVHGKISSSVGATTWTLEARGKRAVPEDHLLLRTLRAPNPMMSGHELMKITQLYLDMVGDSFWLKARNGFRAPVEYWPIPPHWIAEPPTPSRPSFRVSWMGWQDEIPDTEILWMSEPSPVDPYGRGSGLVRAQADEIETHEYASKHAKQLFWNRATPEFVVMDPSAETSEMDRHERAWTNRLQGFWRWYKPYFTNRKLEFWQPQQMNLENLAMVPLMKHERDVILQTTGGIPPEQLGITESSNRATAEASNYIYEERVVKPRREFIRDSLQLRLVPEYDERLILGFVDTVPEDKEHWLKTAQAAPHVPTVDEWRDRLKLKPVGGELGGARLVPLNSYLTSDPLNPASRPQGKVAPAPGEPA
jgi:hypothetical protein